MVLSSCLNILWVLNIFVGGNISVVRYIYDHSITVGDRLDISKRTILPALTRRQAATLIAPSPFIELTKNCVHTEKRAGKKLCKM